MVKKEEKKEVSAKQTKQTDALVVDEVIPETSKTNAYIVQEGDSISDVASKHGISVRTLAQKNNLKSFELDLGQKLNI